MSQPFRMDDIKSLSSKLLTISAIIAIFVLAYILSRINPESRRIRTLQRHPCATSEKHCSSADALIAEHNRLKDEAAAADASFHEAMQCTDANVLVKLGCA